MALFTSDELAAYPGTEGIPQPTAELLTALTEGLIYDLIPQTTADASPRAKGIALEVVARAYRNAGGYATESIDDWSGRRDLSALPPGVYLTADERAQLLDLTADTARPRVRSVRLRSWSVPQT